MSELATRLYNFLITDGPDARFVTLFLAQLDPRDGRFTYASAGHECFLLGPGDQVQLLSSTGMPLGIVPGRVDPGGEILPPLIVESKTALCRKKEPVLSNRSRRTGAAGGGAFFAAGQQARSRPIVRGSREGGVGSHEL